MKKIIVLFLFAFFTSLKFSFASFLDEAISNPDRTYEFVKRDKYRHPKETLNFFGIKSNMTVIELWPSRGWYSEI